MSSSLQVCTMMAIDVVWKVLTVMILISSVFSEEVTNEGRSDRLNIILKTLGSCQDQDVVACLGAKVVGVVERVARMHDVAVVNGVTLVGVDAPPVPLKTDAELQKEIGDAVDGKAVKISEMVIDATARFFTTHTLQVKFPQIDGPEERQLDLITIPIRKVLRKKKLVKLIVALLVIGGIALKAKFLAGFIIPVFLIAKKALILAKLALLYSVFLGTKVLGFGLLPLLKQAEGGENHNTDSYANHHDDQQQGGGFGDIFQRLKSSFGGGNTQSNDNHHQHTHSPPSDSYGTPSDSYGPPSYQNRRNSVWASTRDINDAQDVAYSAHVPETNAS